jgi:hypothetical protein
VIQRANTDGSALQTIFTSLSGWAPAALAFDTSPAQALEDCNHNGVRDLAGHRERYQRGLQRGRRSRRVRGFQSVRAVEPCLRNTR